MDEKRLASVIRARNSASLSKTWCFLDVSQTLYMYHNHLWFIICYNLYIYTYIYIVCMILTYIRVPAWLIETFSWHAECQGWKPCQMCRVALWRPQLATAGWFDFSRKLSSGAGQRVRHSYWSLTKISTVVTVWEQSNDHPVLFVLIPRVKSRNSNASIRTSRPCPINDVAPKSAQCSRTNRSNRFQSIQ